MQSSGLETWFAIVCYFCALWHGDMHIGYKPKYGIFPCQHILGKINICCLNVLGIEIAKSKGARYRLGPELEIWWDFLHTFYLCCASRYWKHMLLLRKIEEECIVNSNTSSWKKILSYRVQSTILSYISVTLFSNLPSL